MSKLVRQATKLRDKINKQFCKYSVLERSTNPRALRLWRAYVKCSRRIARRTEKGV